MTTLIEAIIVLGALGLLSFVSYKRRWLDNEGILIANIVGLSALVLGGGRALVVLLVFFAVGEAATYFVKGKKRPHHQRNTANIVGNALASMVALLLGSTIGFLGAISAALADTLSSEIGVLSKKKPWLITTLRSVETGEDGAVSVLGLQAALVGALIMGLITIGFGFGLKESGVIVLAGVIGSLADSLCGATMQKRGWVDNNEVNFVGSSTGAIVAVGLVSVLRGF